MSAEFVAYLKREHDRLERELEAATKRRDPDQFEIARLKKLKLAVRDQIAANQQIIRIDQAA